MFPGGTFRTGCAASVIYQVRTLFWHLKFTKKGLRARSRKQRKEEMSRYEVSFFFYRFVSSQDSGAVILQTNYFIWSY